MSYFCIPYPFDIGSLNNPICGGKYVNIIKHNNMHINPITAILLLHFCLYSSLVIILYATYSPNITATKKLPISKIAKLVPIIPV